MRELMPDALLHIISLQFKSKSIEELYQKYQLKYLPQQIKQIVLIQTGMMLSLAAILFYEGYESIYIYLGIGHFSMNIFQIYCLKRVFKIAKLVSRIISFLNLVFMIEIAVKNTFVHQKTSFIAFYFAYIKLTSIIFAFNSRYIFIFGSSIYYFLRLEVHWASPLVYCLVACYLFQIYSQEREDRSKFYNLYKENKINGNYKNLIKSAIPCGLLIFTMAQSSSQQLNDLEGEGGVNLPFWKDKKYQRKLEVKFANRHCLEDIGVKKEENILQKMSMFKHLKKYESISQFPLEKPSTNHSKFTSTNQTGIAEKLKENDLGEIIIDFLYSKVNEDLENIEQEQTYLNVLYDNGYSDSKYFDIKVVNCSWEGVAGCLCVLINISQKVVNQRQNRLEEFEKKMMSTITHNLKTPLNGIILLLQSLLEQQSRIPEDIFNQIQDIYTNSDLLLSMINDVLDYSKIQQGCFKVTPKRFRIDKLLCEIRDIYSTQLSMKQLQFYVEYSSLWDYGFYTDQQRLRQILINLIGNALKFTFEGYIRIIVKETLFHSNVIEIEVSDTGSGISKHIKQSLLHSSIGMKDTSKLDKKSGSGIGLNICQCLVDKLGPHSKLFIQSVEKQGTKISFYIYRNLHRNRTGSFNTDSIKRVYKKQFSLRTNKYSPLLQKRDLNQSLEIGHSKLIQSPKDSSNAIGKFLFSPFQSYSILNHSPQNALSCRKDSFAAAFLKTQQNVSPDPHKISQSSSGGAYEEMRKKRVSVFREMFQRTASENNNELIDQVNCIGKGNKKKKDNQNASIKNISNNNYNYNNIDTCNNSIANNQELDSKQDSIKNYFVSEHKESSSLLSQEQTEIFDQSSEGIILCNFQQKMKYNQSQCQGEKTQQNLLNKNSQMKLMNQIYSSAPFHKNELNQLCKSKSNSSPDQSDFFSIENAKTYTQQSQNQTEYENPTKENYNCQDSTQKEIAKSDEIILENSAIDECSYSVKSHSNYQFQIPYPSQKPSYLSSNQVNIPIGDVESQKIELFPNDFLYFKDQKQLKDCNSEIMIENEKQEVERQTKKKLTKQSMSNVINENENEQTGKVSILLQTPLNSLMTPSLQQKQIVTPSQYLNQTKHSFHREVTESDQKIHIEKEISLERNCSSSPPKLLNINGSMSTFKSKTNNAQYMMNLKFMLENKRILIVDDTMFNVIALKSLLQNAAGKNLIIDEAYNGQQAISKVLQFERLYDLILMDVNMPVMDGLQATECIKRINQLNKIIIVTAFSDETDWTQCAQFGADGFLTKPVNVKVLQEEISKVFTFYSAELKHVVKLEQKIE